MSDRAALQVVIPFHQPNWADAARIDDAVLRCYAPLIDAIASRPGIRVALAFHGHLLDHLARRHEQQLLRIKALVEAGQVEVLGGLFYGAVPGLLAAQDVRGQIEMLSQFWESYLGRSPAGFWLPELAWTEGVPHHFAETGLDFGFASATQLLTEQQDHHGLGVVQSGCDRLPVFVLDWQLSQGLPSQRVDDWCDALQGSRSHSDRSLSTVWVRAESLGLEPGTHAWCHDGGWLDRWLDAISGGRADIEPLLPSEGFARVRPAVTFALEPGCAPELRIYGRRAGTTHWLDFPRHFIEVDTLHRRTMRSSGKLSDAIATMEDEELEDAWSDALATAQRHVFAAQGVDAFQRGATPGFSQPEVRETAYAHLVEAGNLIDRLVQGDDDWIAFEEEDLDGDLVDEVFISTAHLMAWIVPDSVGAGFGLVRALDNRRRARTLLDVGQRRTEPFFDVMARAPMAEGRTRLEGVVPRAEHLARLEEDLPTYPDSRVRRGIAMCVFDDGVSAEEYASGSAVDLLGDSVRWQVLGNQIDEEGDCSYVLEARTTAEVAGLRPRTVRVTRSITVPIDEPELILKYQGHLEGDPPAVIATEIPMRLASSQVTLLADGEKVDLSTRQLADVSEVRLEGADGEVVSVQCEPACDVLVAPMRSTVKDLQGYRSAEQGVVLVPLLPIGEPTRGTVRIRFS